MCYGVSMIFNRMWRNQEEVDLKRGVTQIKPCSTQKSPPFHHILKECHHTWGIAEKKSFMVVEPRVDFRLSFHATGAKHCMSANIDR